MAKEKNKTELPKVMEGELQARLIKLREDAGLDVSQMANALCLSEDVINNLENEAFDLLAEPPYVRGYLRNYAKLGDEDASELISRYEALRGADADELNFQIKSKSTITATPKKRLSPVWGQVIVLGILLGGIALLFSIPTVNNWVTEKWQSFSSQLTPSSAENNPSLLGDLPVPSPLPEDELIPAQLINTETNTNPTSEATTANNQTDSTQSTSTDPDNSSNTSNSSATSQAAIETPTETSTATENTSNTSTDNNQTDTNTQEVASTEQVIPASADGTISIKLVFNKEVWLRIKDKDNKTVFEGLNKATTEKNIDLEKPLTFRVGNAQGLSLFIDNKAVDISSYINGSIANFTLE